MNTNHEMTLQEQLDLGRKIIAELRGAAFLENRRTARNSFNADIQDYTDGVCFGGIWARPGLDHKQRALVVIAQLIALNRPVQLRSHLNGALDLGYTVTELQEVLLQSAVYCGLPTALEAYRVAEKVLLERKLLP
jgi:4-carboxymuconolactone decarboxylase